MDDRERATGAEYILATEHTRLMAEKDADILFLRSALLKAVEFSKSYQEPYFYDADGDTCDRGGNKVVRAALKGDDHG